MQFTAPIPGQSKPWVHVHQPFDGRLDSIREARSWATSSLAGRGIAPPEWLDLVVSELATNAVAHTHSGAPYGHYTLRITALFDRIHVEVSDAGPLPGRSPTRVWAHPEATHGRGLALVDTFATRWGLLSSGSGVWAEVGR